MVASQHFCSDSVAVADVQMIRETQVERRLAAILVADIVGYTRQMRSDEVGTLRRLSRSREKFILPLIAEHRGRVVKFMGDGLLVEFASAVDSLSCAIAWQKGMLETDSDTDPQPAFQYRIGINLGDVLVAQEDIYGDSVNVAARLEQIAESGGIILSDDAYRQVAGKVEAAFVDMGLFRSRTLMNRCAFFGFREEARKG